MSTKLNDLSRTVSHALRHEPWLYELELDDEGFVTVEALLQALRQEPAWHDVTAGDIDEMIRTSSKQRHEIADGRIRAIYGHSLPGKLHRTPAEPPELLFHGTAPAIVATILQQGLRPMARQYVHLSVDRAMATAVGQRKASAPVILSVRAGDAAKVGVRFYAGNDKVWLADEVPATFISN